MPHTTRVTYKDQAMSISRIKHALVVAEQQVRELTEELDGREEREAELMSAMFDLQRPMQVLSANLYNFLGDFEVESTAPDPGIDEMLGQMRPAKVVKRATLLMAMAARRLEELHLEAENLHESADMLAKEVSRNADTLEQARFRRNFLLIHGSMVTEAETKQVGVLEDVYKFRDVTLTTDEVLEVADVEIDKHDASDTEENTVDNKMAKERSKAKASRAKLTKKHQARLRLR